MKHIAEIQYKRPPPKSIEQFEFSGMLMHNEA
jgi:hypothetical protein